MHQLESQGGVGLEVGGDVEGLENPLKFLRDSLKIRDGTATSTVVFVSGGLTSQVASVRVSIHLPHSGSDSSQCKDLRVQVSSWVNFSAAV